MPITPYLAGQAFEPEVIREISLALESVCDTLKLRLTDDSNTRLVASKIIELAQRGVQDAPTLGAMTLKEFKHYQAPLARPPRLSRRANSACPNPENHNCCDH